jgi:transposase InsO family protein
MYIITMKYYLMIWEEVEPFTDCSMETTTQLLFKNIATRLGCPKVLMSDQGTHILNKIIAALTKEFQIHHKNTLSYHPQENGTVESFHKILENALENICNVGKYDRDLRIHVVL